MDEATMRARVRAARVARMATIRPDGRPHLVVCCFSLDRDVVYTPVDEKPKTTRALQRVKNLAANPLVSIVVDHYEEDWSALWWVRLDGHGRVVERDPERDRALSLLADKYEQYRTTRPAGPVIAVDVAGWRAWP